MKRTNIVWFSRHELNKEQLRDLQRIYGEINIYKINKTISSASEYVELIENLDGLGNANFPVPHNSKLNNVQVHALVAPIELVQEIIEYINIISIRDHQFIFCKSKRILAEDGEKVTFKHDGWFQYLKIEIET